MEVEVTTPTEWVHCPVCDRDIPKDNTVKIDPDDKEGTVRICHVDYKIKTGQMFAEDN